MISNEEYIIWQAVLWLMFIFAIVNLFRLIYNFYESHLTEALLVLSVIIMGLGGLIGGIVMLFNCDYSKSVLKTYYPVDVDLMYDKYEVVIKHEDFRYEITDRRYYERVMDSCFYIKHIKHYDIFGGLEETIYDLKTFDKKDKKEAPIKIEL